MKKLAFPFLLLSFQLLSAQTTPVSIQVNTKKTVGDMTPFWTWFGYDEPNYTYREYGKKLLNELRDMSPVPVAIRTHNLLTSKGGSPGPDLKWGYTDVYKEDAAGNPVYNWTIMDSIIDVYVQRKMTPLMEIGFMPKDLSTKPEPYEHYFNNKGGVYNTIYTGWTYPPKDYKKWAELVYQWVQHSIQRYGKEEVKKWYWEVWNEPNIDYWSGTVEEYCKLYDYAIDAVKRACPECTVGGPHTTGPGWEKAYAFLQTFLEHCLNGTNYATGKKGSPLQFVAYHAKGGPTLVDGHVRMNMGTQLNDVAKGFELVNKFPELKNIPVIIGECDPEGCAACSEKREPRYAYRNGTMYSSYTAASFARIYELMDLYKVNLKGAVSWSFEFEDQEWFAGFRDLATHGVDKPVLNIFRMFALMKGKRVEVVSSDPLVATGIIQNGVKGKPDVNAMATRDNKSISVMIWNYHDDDLPAQASPVELLINGIDKDKVLLSHYRVDQQYSNSFEKWKAMGKPQEVTDEQYKQLEMAGLLERIGKGEWTNTKDGKLQLKFDLPRQGVSLVRLSWQN